MHIISSEISLNISDCKIITVHNDVTQNTVFDCSHQILNQIYDSMLRTLRNNFHGKITDTPLYEKNGWLGDINVALDTMFVSFDIASLLESWLDDVKIAQREDGLVPLIVPTGGFGYDNDTVWTSAYFFAVFAVYQYTGNESILKKHYKSLCKLADNYLKRLEKNNFLDGGEYLADWSSPTFDENYDATPPENSVVVGSIYSSISLDKMAKIAKLLNKKEDEKKHLTVSKKVKEAIMQNCFDESLGYFTSEIDINHLRKRSRYRQTQNLLPCVFNIVRGDEYERVKKSLIEDLVSKNCLDVGIVGNKYILPFLSEIGEIKLAYDMAVKTDYPSVGYMVLQGAGTLWESYEKSSRSYNHYFLGTMVDWIFGYVAGIRDIEIAYRTVTIAPMLFEYINTCSLETITPRGKLCVSYDDSGVLSLKIPVGTTARVIWNKKTHVLTAGEYQLD